MKFDYLERVVVEAQLEVENIGQCVLEGSNLIGEFFYLIVRTEMGYTEVINVGPVCPDLPLLPISVSIAYQRFEYNQSKIERLIDKFLNDPKKAISTATVTTFETIMPEINKCIQNMFQEVREDFSCEQD